MVYGRYNELVFMGFLLTNIHILWGCLPENMGDFTEFHVFFLMGFNHDPGFVEGVFFICPAGNLLLSKSERKRGDFLTGIRWD